MLKHPRIIKLLAIVLLVGLLAGGASLIFRRHHRENWRRAQGMSAAQLDQHSLAAYHLGLYLRRHPDDVEALIQCARARSQSPLANNEHLRQSRVMLERAVGLRPGDKEAWRDLGEVQLILGDARQAERSGVRATEVDPTDARACLLVATSLAARSEVRAAIAELDRGLTQTSDRFEVAWLRSVLAPLAGISPEENLRRARDLAATDPSLALLPFLVENQNNDQRVTTAAITSQLTQAKLTPTIIRAIEPVLHSAGHAAQWRSLILAQSQLLQKQAVQRRYARSVWADGKPDALANDPALLHLGKGELDPEFIFLLALSRRVGHDGAPRKSLLPKVFQRHWRPAIQALEEWPLNDAKLANGCAQALSVEPGNPSLRTVLRLCLARNGERELASQLGSMAPAWKGVERALSQPAVPGLDTQLARCREADATGNPTSLSLWLQASADHPTNLAIQYESLAAIERYNRPELERAIIDRICMHSPEAGLRWKLAVARWNLAYGTTENKTSEAALLMHDALKSVPRFGPANLLLGWSLAKMRDPAGATERLARAVESTPALAPEAVNLIWKLRADGLLDDPRRVVQAWIAVAAASPAYFEPARDLHRTQSESAGLRVSRPLHLLARKAVELRDLPLAERAYRRLLEIDSRDAVAASNLALILEKTGAATLQPATTGQRDTSPALTRARFRSAGADAGNTGTPLAKSLSNPTTHLDKTP